MLMCVLTLYLEIASGNPSVSDYIVIPLIPFLQERDKALDEVGSLKKENKSLNSKVTNLTSELSALKSAHSKLETEFKQVEGHRDMLLDKVERLHADKHKLEDR